MAAKYDLKQSSNDKFYFNLKAANGEVILTSQMYTTKDAAHNGIESVKTNSPIDERYERKTSSKDEPYFVLKAANGEDIGKSEMYTSTSARDGGIDSVKTNGPNADIDDQTG